MLGRRTSDRAASVRRSKTGGFGGGHLDRSELPSPNRYNRWKSWAVLAGALLLLAGCATPTEKPQPQEVTDLIWPLPPEQPRIRFLRTLSSKDDVESGRKQDLSDILLGKKELTIDTLRKPYGVHADRDGRVFVTDTGWGRLVVFDIPNKSFSFWGLQGKGQLRKPAGVTSDSEGRVYVTDTLEQRVVVYDRDGKFLLAMGKKGELETPVGIAVNEKLGRVYVVDTRRHQIVVFDMTGTLVTRLGERGSDPGQFNFPTNLAIDDDGKLYVTDSMNFRVQILDPDGKVLKTFGNVGDARGQFARPKGIAVDSDGDIYVVDAAFNNFQIFDQEGRLLMFVGQAGPGPGQFWLPAGAYIDHQDRLYVADQYNRRIQVFQYLSDRSTSDTSTGALVESPAQKEAGRD